MECNGEIVAYKDGQIVINLDEDEWYEIAQEGKRVKVIFEG
jgi:hypothetical protein